MASLEEELGIPMEATLIVPPQLPSPLCLSFITPQQQFLETLTLFNPLSRSDLGNEDEGDCVVTTISTLLSPTSSMRNNGNHTNTTTNNGGTPHAAAPLPPRCLIVGRQASASDIRIDHKSVSRKHTALYYSCTNKNKHSQSQQIMDEDSEESSLVVHDLGGKFGTYVNGTRLEMNGKLYLPLQTRGGGMTNNIQIQHEIRFGNSPLICRVTNLNINDDDKVVSQSILPTSSVNTIDIGGDNNSASGNDDVVTTTTDQTTQDETAQTNNATTDNKMNDTIISITNINTNDESTREAREVQIAAMPLSHTFFKFVE
jgi:pSer/pThr/pTyr-binding forkhead associated (FHA) protein